MICTKFGNQNFKIQYTGNEPEIENFGGVESTLMPLRITSSCQIKGFECEIHDTRVFGNLLPSGMIEVGGMIESGRVTVKENSFVS